MIPPTLVQAAHDGIRLMPNVLCSLMQPDGQFVYTNGQLVSAQWCSHDLLNCVDDVYGFCPIDECTHVVWVYASGSDVPVYVEPTAWLPVTFSASHLDGFVQMGAWAGPPDWTLDGVIDSTDFYAFLNAFFAGEADYDMSGTTDSQDLFTFLGDFEG